MNIIVWLIANIQKLCLLYVMLNFVSSNDFTNNFNYDPLADYGNISTLSNFLLFIKSKYPNYTEIFSIGKTIKNNPIIAIRINNFNEYKFEPRPKVKLLANIHGNEPVGRQILLQLIVELISRSTDKYISDILKTTDIYIVPSLNPDGFQLAVEGDCIGIIGRSNSNGVNINSDFSSEDPQPETIALKKWFLDKKFTLSASFHSSGIATLIPYDEENNSLDFVDKETFYHIANSYKQLNPNMHNHNVCFKDVNNTPYNQSIISGNQWFPINGSMMDYNFKLAGCLELTFYIACCKYPHHNYLKDIWLQNKESLLTFIKQAHIGIKGYISDSTTHKRIIGAKVEINGSKISIWSDEQGAYFRLLVQGVYMLNISAPGYQYLVKKVVVNHLNVKRIDFYLWPVFDSRQNSLTSIINYANGYMNKEQRKKLPTFIDIPISRYMHFEEMEEWLKKVVYNYSSITRLYTIGASVLGRPLYVLELSNQPGVHTPGVVEFKYIGNMHGNEVVGRVMLCNLIMFFTINYGKNEFINLLMNHTRIHILISMNPDGFEMAKLTSEDKSDVMGRENAAKVDLNRDFPDQFNFATYKHAYQPESIAVMSWIQSLPFVLSANLHGGALVANYPFDNSAGLSQSIYSKSPDDAVFKHLAEIYSIAHESMHDGRPCPNDPAGFKDGITNGAQWYSVSGGMQDWNYVSTNCFEITLELGCIKYPMESDLEGYWQANKYALIVFIAQAHRGIRGFITDGFSGLPLSNVSISVGLKHPIISAIQGDYWRILEPGNYTITASLEGYDKVTKNVLVTNGASTLVNFQLYPNNLNTSSLNNLDYQDFFTSKNILNSSITKFYEPQPNANFSMILQIIGISVIVITLIFIILICRHMARFSNEQKWKSLAQEEVSDSGEDDFVDIYLQPNNQNHQIS